MVAGIDRVFPEDCLEIDSRYWGITNPTSGTDWAATTEGMHRCFKVIPDASMTARLVHKFAYACSPTVFGDSDSYFKGCVYEFPIKLADVANIDNTKFFLGLSQANDADRSTNDIFGFILSSDGLYALEDDGGTEETEDLSDVTLTDWNLFRIEIWNGYIMFYVNNVLRKTIASSLEGTYYPNFFIDTEAGGAASLFIGEQTIRLTTNPTDYNYNLQSPMYHFVKKAKDKWFDIILTEKNNPNIPIVGKLPGEMVIEYYNSETDTAFSNYTMADDQWVELDNGMYKFQMGADEFPDINEYVLVRLTDDKYSATSLVLRCDVMPDTMANFMTVMGTGDPGTYNIYNTQKAVEAGNRATATDLDKVMERLAKVLSQQNSQAKNKTVKELLAQINNLRRRV